MLSEERLCGVERRRRLFIDHGHSSTRRAPVLMITDYWGFLLGTILAVTLDDKDGLKLLWRELLLLFGGVGGWMSILTIDAVNQWPKTTERHADNGRLLQSALCLSHTYSRVQFALFLWVWATISMNVRWCLVVIMWKINKDEKDSFGCRMNRSQRAKMTLW